MFDVSSTRTGGATVFRQPGSSHPASEVFRRIGARQLIAVATNMS